MEILDKMQKVGFIEFRKGSDTKPFETISYYLAPPDVGIAYLDRALIGPTWYDLRNQTCIQSIEENDISEIDKLILPMLLDREQTPIKGWVALCPHIPHRYIDKEISMCKPEDLVSP